MKETVAAHKEQVESLNIKLKVSIFCNFSYIVVLSITQYATGKFQFSRPTLKWDLHPSVFIVFHMEREAELMTPLTLYTYRSNFSLNLLCNYLRHNSLVYLVTACRQFWNRGHYSI